MNPDVTKDENLRILVEELGMPLDLAETILAIETGEIDGDVEALDSEGSVIREPSR